MGRGRPPKGADLVDGLKCSEGAGEKAKVILGTMLGTISIEDACRTLGIGAARFHQLRTQALQGLTESLEPRPVGRPGHVPTEAELRTRELEQELQDVKRDLRAAQIREEIAIMMPHLRKTEDIKKRRGRGPGESAGGAARASGPADE